MNTAADFERVACEAAHAAGRMIKERFTQETSLSIERKGVHDFVTAVDRDAEGLVIAHLRKHCPEHTVMAEEGSPEAPDSDYRWIVDPLDGTTNFIHGVPVFAVSVALEDRQGLLAGAIYDPLREETFHAHRSGGARLNGRPIRCSEPQDTRESLIATGFPFREFSRVDAYLEAFRAFIGSTAGLRRAGSASIDLAYTACGRYDGFWEIGLSRWDIAAGVLLVREAGGTVTDITGGDSCLDTGDIVAAGKRVHPTMLKVTRSAFRARGDKK